MDYPTGRGWTDAEIAALFKRFERLENAQSVLLDALLMLGEHKAAFGPPDADELPRRNKGGRPRKAVASGMV